MAGDEFKIEDRFSRSRGLFPYILGLIGVAVLVVIMMIVTGIGVEYLPYGEFLVARAPEAADGSEALSLQSLKHVTDEKTTLTVEGTVMNRTEDTISGLVAVIEVKDKFTLPVATVNIPVDPVDLEPNAIGTFQMTVMLGEHGLLQYSVVFRLPDEGPFVPHKDERPLEPTLEQSPPQ